VRLAWRGLRDLDSGSEQITDDEVMRAVRLQARRVQVRAVTAAALLTAVFIIMT
jgi:hypothetical protein